MTFSADRIKHLEFIQAIIARQAAHSFAVKGWSLTVSTAVYAYTASHLTWWLAVVALLPAIAFAYLDLVYLRNERIFRELYDDAAKVNSLIPLFEIKPNRYFDEKKYPKCRHRNVMRSGSWAILHSMTVGVGLVILGFVVFQ